MTDLAHAVLVELSAYDRSFEMVTGIDFGRTPQVISAIFLIANRIETFVGSIGCNSTSQASQPYVLRSLIGRL